MTVNLIGNDIMKKWPKDDKPASFEDLTKPFELAIKFAFKLTRKNKDLGIPYSGYDNGDLTGCPGIQQLFSKESLDYNLGDQGRDALTVIVQAAIQVGIEQGRRIAMDSAEVKTLRLYELIAKSYLENHNNPKT